MLVSLSDVLTSEGKVETVAIPLEMTSFKSRQGEFPITEKRKQQKRQYSVFHSMQMP